MRISRLLAAAVLGIWLPNVSDIAAAEIDQPPTLSDLARLFEDVALGDEYARRAPSIVKWSSAPTLRVETLVPETGKDVPDLKFRAVPTNPQRYAFLAAHVANLGRLAGKSLRLLPIDIGDGGNIIVSIVPRTRFSDFKIPGVSESLLRKLTGPGTCYFLIWPDNAGNIVRGHVVIADNRDETRLSHCFIEETTQAMGLPNDSRIVHNPFSTTVSRASP